MTLNEIRREIARRPDKVREILLSPQQAQVLRYARKRPKPTYSRDLVQRFDFTPQHACMVLERLYRKGYLTRGSDPQESGGYEYAYVSAI